MKNYLIVLVVLTSTLCFAGPFGFEAGMTKAQIAAQVGSLKDNGDNFYTTKTAPKPSKEIESYTLQISPKYGLVGIVAATATEQSNDEGTQLKQKFENLQRILMANYGEPEETNNGLVDPDATTAPRFWMMELKDKNRRLESKWRFTSRQDKLVAITVTCMAADIQDGYVLVLYIFEDGEKTVKEEKEKDSSVF
jgi:hypothetical protein